MTVRPAAATGEFALIARHFVRPLAHTRLGIGDDAALLAPRAGHTLAVSTDLLVEGTHFLPGTDACRLGHKTLAVNLSDLAAMGATPRWAFLAVALPEADDAWLAAFADGFFALAAAHGVDLAGGDTTRGPRALCVTVAGEVPEAAALRRDGARAGDDVWLTGCTGEAAAGLAVLQGRATLDAADAAHCRARLEAPTPRVAAGLALRGIATAAIDVSDGLLADAGHIAVRSQVRIAIERARLPQSSALAGLDARMRADAVVAGGDDYELLLCAPRDARAAVDAAGTDGPRAELCDRDGRVLPVARTGFDHFAAGAA
ncbi:MAG: thiamine-phosphate kinase [Burkholderiales bacterium]|nr:thiamine-phosphate kinase [Burkholderiales bacterium]